jgi:hypothetical protein
MRACGTGYGVPMDTVSHFFPRVVYNFLLLGRTDSVYYRTGPLRSALQSVLKVSLVIVVPRLRIS